MATGEPDTKAREAADATSLARRAAARAAGTSASSADSAAPQNQSDRTHLEPGDRHPEYFELFDRAPVAYLTLRDGDVVREANATAARLLGVEREALVGRPFSDLIFAPDRDVFQQYLQTLHGSGEQHAVELRLDLTENRAATDREAPHMWTRLASTVQQGADGTTEVWMTFTNIDRDRRAEAVVQARARISESALGASLDEIIQKLLDEAEESTGSEIGFFHFVDEDEPSATLQTWSTNTPATQCTVEGKSFHNAVELAGVWADCLRERRPLIHNDYASLPNRRGLPEGRARVVRELTVPVFRGDKVRAIIGVGNKPTDYDSCDVDTLEQIAVATLDIVYAKRAEEDLRRATLLLQAVIDGTSDAVYVKDLKGRYLMFNQAAARVTGTSPERVIGCDDTTLFPADEAAVVMAGDRRVIEGGVTTTYEERVTIGDKGLVIFSSTKGPVRDSSGTVYGLFGIARDVTEQVHAEAALSESERWLRESQRVADLGHYVFDIVNDHWTCSTTLSTVFGIDDTYQRDFAGWLNVVHPEDRDTMSSYFREEVLGKDVPFDTDYRIVRPSDGAVRWVHGLGKVEWHEDGHPLAMFGIIQDVTESKNVHEALRERSAFIEAALDNAPIGFALNAIDDGHSVFVGRSFERIFGVEPGGLGDVSTFFEQVYRNPVVREEMRERIAADIASGDPSRMRWENIPITTQSGEDRVVSASNIPLADQNLMISTVEDVTERWRAEHALRESEARFRAVFEGAADGIMLLDSSGALAFVNAAMARMHGYTVEEMRSMDLAELDTPEATQLAPERFERLSAGEALSFEAEHTRKDGERFPLEISANSVTLGGETYVLAFHRDITRRRQAEEEIAHLAEERERNLEELAASLASIISVVGLIVETRDPYTAGHERRVAELSVRIAQEMGMSDDQVEEIRIAGLLHDVGKISVPAEILSKPGRLTSIEFSLIKCHAADSYRILSSANMGSEIAEMVYQHHERCDGSGYPRGLGGRELVDGAKVLMVADVVEAMSTDRPYRAALGVEPALAEIERGAGLQYDVAVAEACKRVFEAGFEFTQLPQSRRADSSCPTPPVTPE